MARDETRRHVKPHDHAASNTGRRHRHYHSLGHAGGLRARRWRSTAAVRPSRASADEHAAGGLGPVYAAQILDSSSGHLESEQMGWPLTVTHGTNVWGGFSAAVRAALASTSAVPSAPLPLPQHLFTDCGGGNEWVGRWVAGRQATAAADAFGSHLRRRQALSLTVKSRPAAVMHGCMFWMTRGYAFSWHTRTGRCCAGAGKYLIRHACWMLPLHSVAPCWHVMVPLVFLALPAWRGGDRATHVRVGDVGVRRPRGGHGTVSGVRRGSLYQVQRWRSVVQCADTARAASPHGICSYDDRMSWMPGVFHVVFHQLTWNACTGTEWATGGTDGGTGGVGGAPAGGDRLAWPSGHMLSE